MSEHLRVSYETLKDHKTGKHSVLLTEEVLNSLELKVHKEGANIVTGLDIITFLRKMVKGAN